MNSGEDMEAGGTVSAAGHRTPGPALLVLAAGMGSRFGGPKQLTPVNAAGETLLHYAVYDAVRAGFSRVVFVIRRDMEQMFQAAVIDRLQHRVSTACAFQELDSLLPGPPPAGRTKPWGTLQATLVGAALIDGPFAVINADDFYGAEGYRLLARHLQTDADRCAMAGFRLRNTLSDFGPVSRGVCQVGAGGLLVHVEERKHIARTGNGGAADTATSGTITALDLDAVVSMNMWGLQGSVVPLLRAAFQNFLASSGNEATTEAYLPEAMNKLVTAGQADVAVLPTAAVWCGMTYREDLPGVVERIRQMTSNGEYPDVLWP